MPTLSGLVRRLGRYLAGNALGALALVVALSGTAYAMATIGTDEIIDDSVQSRDIQNGTLGGVDVGDGTLTGLDVRDGTIGLVDVRREKWVKVLAATSAGNCDNGALRELCNYGDDGYGVHTWQNYGAPYGDTRFRRDATSEVTLQGLVRAEGFTEDWLHWQNPIFVLPPGYTPGQSLIFAVTVATPGGEAFGAIQVDPDGWVTYHGPWNNAATWVSLAGVSYSVN
jgi:hypothetical protein